MTSSSFQSIAVVVAVALGFAIIAIGGRFLIDPAAAASGFGVPARPDDSAYLIAKGLRDIVLGLSGLTLIALGHRDAAGWFFVVVALVPAGDVCIVLTHGGSIWVALGVHGATAVVLVFVGAALVRHGKRSNLGRR